MIVLLVVMVVDYVTGVIDGYYNKKLSSKTGFKGILKKCSILLVVACAMIIDKYYNFNVSYFMFITFICNDLLSIAENLYNVGIDVKGLISEIIKLFKNEKRGG